METIDGLYKELFGYPDDSLISLQIKVRILFHYSLSEEHETEFWNMYNMINNVCDMCIDIVDNVQEYKAATQMVLGGFYENVKRDYRKAAECYHLSCIGGFHRAAIPLYKIYNEKIRDKSEFLQIVSYLRYKVPLVYNIALGLYFQWCDESDFISYFCNENEKSNKIAANKYLKEAQNLLHGKEESADIYNFIRLLIIENST